MIYKLFTTDADKELPNLQPVFITVDPLRYTPKAMKQYCEGMQEFSYHLYILISYSMSCKLVGAVNKIVKHYFLRNLQCILIDEN